MSTSRKNKSKNNNKIPVKMGKLSTENLFLLEFLVDELKMEGKCDCSSTGEVCVSFQFLDNEALDVCEGDFSSDNKFGQDNCSKTGKSCLFSLTPDQAKETTKKFDIVVGVFKKMPPGQQPEKALIGSVNVSVLNIFLDLLDNKDPIATAKVLQETYKLLDANGALVGRIGVYIRLSCYGKMIITQFQMNVKDKSVLFKDKDGHSLYRYKKAKRGKTTKIEDLSCPAPQTYNNQGGQCPMPAGNGMGYAGQSSRMPQNLPPPNANCPTQPCFPPPNPNCPAQPCFPSQEMGMGGFGMQHPQPQPSFGGNGGGCGGCCSRR